MKSPTDSWVLLLAGILLPECSEFNLHMREVTPWSKFFDPQYDHCERKLSRKYFTSVTVVQEGPTVQLKTQQHEAPFPNVSFQSHAAPCPNSHCWCCSFGPRRLRVFFVLVKVAHLDTDTTWYKLQVNWTVLRDYTSLHLDPIFSRTEFDMKNSLSVEFSFHCPFCVKLNWYENTVERNCIVQGSHAFAWCETLLSGWRAWLFKTLWHWRNPLLCFSLLQYR